MKTKLNILMILAFAASLVGGNIGVAQATIPEVGYVAAGSINVAPAIPALTAVDPLAWGMFGDVLPARPFLYSVDATGR